MKPISLLMSVVILLTACKKDKDGENKPKTVLLSASYTNGNLAYRFAYSKENQVTKIDLYDAQSPSALVAAIIAEYDANGHLSQATTYSEPGHKANTRTVIDSTHNGNIILASAYDLQGPSPNVPSTTQKRTYNAQGRLSKLESRDKNGKLKNYINLSYYPDGSVKQIDSYKDESGLLYKVEKRVYAIPGTQRTKGVDALDPLLGYDFIAPMINEGYQIFNYDQNGGLTFQRQYTMSGREYSADSTLTRQTITIKNVKPASADVVAAKQYEYITQ